MPVDVSPTLEGLDPRFQHVRMSTIRAQGRRVDFEEAGMDLSQAFDPVPNVMNSKSVRFDDSDVGSCHVKSLVLPHDHAMSQRQVNR